MAAQEFNLIHVTSNNHLLQEIKKTSKRLIVLYFTATWCGPCQFIAPIFENISEKYKKVVFLKIDVDQCQETALSYGVQSMPTFLFTWKGEKIDHLRGADSTALEQLVQKWADFAENERKRENITIGRRMGGFCELLTNSKDEFLRTSELLIRFAENVLKDVNNMKYRSIRLKNKIFQERILPFNGAVQCLFEMGFQENNDKLLLPMDASLETMEALRDALLDEREKHNISKKAVDCFPPVIASDPFKNFNPAIRTQNQLAFYQRLKSSATHVFIYEEPDMIRYCLSKIPIDKLKKEAAEKSSATTVDEKDCLLLFLLNWFKSEFFAWMNQPNCDICNNGTQGIGSVPPSVEDKRWGAGTVENYICRKCNKTFTFPRYNHPQKLLETRTGRCGEWANCFSACCRAVGFETRHVLDWTDHVWTEVYSEHQNRWLHCDPCENVCDKPLLYEAGWGKKLSYVIAFSKDEVFDVTWRYSQNHKEVLARRKEVDENWLVSLWMSMCEALQAKNTAERNKELERRKIVELVGFLGTKSASEEEKIGRQSGSMAWRLIRGEAGTDSSEAKKTEAEEKSYTFMPTVLELEQGRLRVVYCAATDKYTRGIGSVTAESSSIHGWQLGTASSNGIFRKVEHDWKMVYLARQQGISHGTVSWKFKISDNSYAINSIEIKASSTTFKSGIVQWTLGNGDMNEELPVGGSLKTTNFKGSDEISLVAHLEGGEGDVAWQHAQLFRQKLDNDDEVYGLDITITFSKRF